MNLTELHASLNRQKGVFDRWAHSRLNEVENIRQKHQVDMKKASEEFEELKENQHKLLSEVEKLDSTIKEENQEAQDLLEKLTDKQRTTDLLPQEVQRLEDEVSLKEDLLSQREEEIGAQSDKVETKIRNLQKVADLYGDRLGLTFKHATKDEKNNALRIGFTQIDRRNPNKEFWFDVCVTAEEAYAIRNVSPSVQGIQALEDDLNEDSDFSKFVRRMRRKFKESV